MLCLLSFYNIYGIANELVVPDRLMMDVDVDVDVDGG